MELRLFEGLKTVLCFYFICFVLLLFCCFFSGVLGFFSVKLSVSLFNLIWFALVVWVGFFFSIFRQAGEVGKEKWNEVQQGEV